MKTALRIIAVTEVIRAIQNMVQLKLLISDKRRVEKLQDKAYEKYVESMDKTLDDEPMDCPWK